MMKFYLLTLGILATWRLTHLLSQEAGPWELFARLRHLAGTSTLGELLNCFYCLSLWIAAPLALLIDNGWRERLLLWLALSAGSILLERVTSPRQIQTRLDYFEDPENESQEDDHVLRN